MDIGRFQSKLNNLIGGKSINTKGSDAEKIKQEAGFTAQTGPAADTVEIKFGRLAEVSNPPQKANADIAGIISNVSQMSAADAQAALNPEVSKKLVQAGSLE
ncbi:hypothetical protein [Vampirovibrio sp.]|uniref:hypothetical protein n=1 Tax=Vampirovibrio sp. TaxID=2717857 RepID=UPI0035939672